MVRIGMNAVQLTPLVCHLFRRTPETRYFQAWELQSLLWLLGYTHSLEPEDAIAAAVDGARMDYDPDRSAA